MHEDRFVDAHDGIPIAVRDHHGEGPDLVLLHGAGGHLLSLFNLVRKLESDFRIVSMDARWSGQSGDSERYDWGAVINLDGHGNGNPSLYDGLTEDDGARAVTLMQAANDPTPAGTNEGDDAWHATARAETRSMSELLGVPAAMVDDWTDRNFVPLAPGRWRRHPSPTLFAGLQGDLDLFSLCPTIDCPLQVFAAARPNVDVVALPDFHHNGVLA